MAMEVENLFTLDPGQIFIVRDAFAWWVFISKWNPFSVLSWCVFRSLRSKQEGGWLNKIGIVFLKFPAKFGLIFETFSFVSFFFFISLSLPIIVYTRSLILNQLFISFSRVLNLQSAFLEVVIPPDIISEETSNDLMVPEGGSAKLVCKARGYPKPEIIWKREDGAEIISRAGLSGGKTKCEYNYTYYHIIRYIRFSFSSKYTFLYVSYVKNYK